MITKTDKAIYSINLIFILGFTVPPFLFFYYLVYFISSNNLTPVLFFLAIVAWGGINTIKYLYRNNWKISGFKWFEIIFLMAPLILIIVVSVLIIISR